MRDDFDMDSQVAGKFQKPSGGNDKASIRFTAACQPADLAYDDPAHRTAPPADAGVSWTILPVSGEPGVPWTHPTLRARWPKPRVIHGISLVFFTCRQPDIQVPDLEDITLQGWDAARRRWRRVPASFDYDESRRRCLADLLDSGYVSLVCRFTQSVTASLLRIKAGQPPRQCVLHDIRPHRSALPGKYSAVSKLGRYVRNRREYDDFVSRVFPGLAAETESCPAGVAAEFFRRRLQPYRGRALLGLKDDLVSTGVDWNHTLMEERAKGEGRLPGVPLIISFWVGEPPRAFGGATGRNARRHLAEGWMPWVNSVCRAGGVEYRLATFVQPFSGKHRNSFTRIRCTAINRARASRPAAVTIAAAAMRKLRARTWRLEDLGLRRRGAWLYDDAGAPAMQIPRGGVFKAGLENTVRYQCILRTGGQRVLDFTIPRLGFPATGRRGNPRPGSFDRAARAARVYWRGMLAGGAETQLPDASLNAFWKNALTQFFITAQGDRLPYGAFPSHYGGSVFGIEEGWTMQALACAGYGGDALRYFSNTYLTDAHLDKGNYHHQYRAGYALAYAYSLLRLAGDKAWLREHLERLRAEADWIIRARRKTMRASGGRRPLHWGLLPHHYYGGDVHEPAYSLHPNAVCWRGLRDFSLMLQSLDAPEARGYLREADAYKRRIETVIGRTIHRGADETFLSMKLYWDQPYPYNGVFWPLFCSMFLETGIMNPAGADAQGLAAWMRRRRKTIAGIPVLYPMRLDPVYGLGLALVNLRSGNIDEYLKTVAAYQTFLLDPYFHTAPESGDLCLRDQDAIWEIRSEDNTWRQWMNPSSPLASAAAVLFLLLRHMLAMEGRGADGAPDGRLLLMPACPPAWQQQGRRVRAARLATEYGAVSFDFAAPGGKTAYRCRIDFAPAGGCRELGVRIGALAPGQARQVTVNGRERSMRPDATGALWFPAIAGNIDIIIRA